jgi:hypothetical protein
MNRRQFVLSAPLALVVAPALPSFAHHGWSSFDETRPLYFTGKVKSMKWQNPHAEVVITMTKDATLPADLAKRIAPKQTNPVDGAKVLSTTTLPKQRGDWQLELSPMTRIEAWKVAQPKVGDTVAAVGYTFKNEEGAMTARVEYWIIGDQMYGLRSMPA